MALFSQLGNYRNFGLFVLRAGLGVMMFLHGLPELTGGIDQWATRGHSMGLLNIHFFPILWGFLCAITETIGGIFCVLGLWFRLVCVLMVINFIVAILYLFSKDHSVLGASESIELAFVFFGLIFVGPGTISIDKG